MGTSLNGLTPAGTYPGLIKTGDNAPIDGTLKTLSDGNGNNLPMEASTTAVNFTNQLQQGGVAVPTASQVAAKQDTLVSGTNIKTINGTSVLGSGNIVTPSTNPSGVAGAIQFSNGSAFASDAANLFWDDTNNRLGIGTNAPTTSLQIDYASSSLNGILINQTGGSNNFSSIGFANNGTIRSTFGMNLNNGEVRWFNNSGGYFATIYGNGVEAMRIDISQNVNIGATALGARLGIKGSGSTSATTSLLVQNSGGSTAMQVQDDLSCTLNSGNSGAVKFSLGANSLNINFIANNSGWGLIAGGGVRHYISSAEAARLDQNGAWVVGKGSNADASAITELTSTTKGFLPPRMTTTQKNAIATPAAGLVVYDSTTNKLCCYNGSTWNDLF